MPAQSPLPSPFATLVAGTPVRAGEVVLRGTPTRLWVYGAPDAAHRVVFLHGFRGDHHGLEPIVAHLASGPGTGRDRADVQVVVPDLPGFGASPRFAHDPHDVAAYARWARDLLAAVAPDGDAVLAGHSFGSIVAAATIAGTAVVAGTAVGPAGTAVAPTTDAAPPVRALMLVNPIPAPALTGPNALATRGTVVLHRLAGALPERAGTALLRHPLVTRVASVAMVTTRDRSLRRWIHEEHDRYFAGFADRRTLLESFGASVTGSVATWAARVPVPTLLVGGDSDSLAPLAAQHDLAAVFGDARLVVLPGVGHLTHYEAPDAVAEALRDFLGEVGGGRVAPGDLVATPEGAA